MTQKQIKEQKERVEYERIGEIVDKTFREVTDFIKQKSASGNQEKSSFR